MSKIIIKFTDNETARKVLNLLTDLRDGRCGLRSIANALRGLLSGKIIEHDEQ